MTRIFLDGKEKIFSDWYIWSKEEEPEKILLTVVFPSQKKYTRPYEEWVVEPVVERPERLIFNKEKKTYAKVEKITEVGGKFFLISYPSNPSKKYVVKCAKVECIEENSNQGVLEYYKAIAEERTRLPGKEDKQGMVEDVLRQFQRLICIPGRALDAYLSKRSETYELQPELIYPFGINQTQMRALEQAFRSQFSVIEGPPGTGKTQTILNLIANIVIQGKTCAIVSNNNSAVKNVYEKLEKQGLGCFVAKLGKKENQEAFFKTLRYRKPQQENGDATLEKISKIVGRQKEHLQIKNRLAKIKSEISEIQIEKKYLEDWKHSHPEIEILPVSKYRLNATKTVDLLAYLNYLSDRFLSFRDKFELLLNYKIFRSGFLKDLKNREGFIFSLQMAYYRTILKERQQEEKVLQEQLKEVDFDEDLKLLTEKSLQYFKAYLAKEGPEKIPDMRVDDYKESEKFDNFIKYFPVIGSSTHSLLNSIPQDYQFDYVIIDEASQQDLVPGVLCFSCTKNVVVVGDSKQLPHIPSDTNIRCPEEVYDCQKYSMLDSVKQIYRARIPITLLKEHYRCHPQIIQFCNKQFYDGQLIPMREDEGKEALSLVVTAKGNHMRNFRNQREIESVLKGNEESGFIMDDTGKEIGFIAPYNNQVNLAKDMLPDNFLSSTIHKFQGREGSEIIFSTVLDKKAISKKQRNFVDDASLVNVAVSRAKDRFILVTGQDVFAKNGYIAALKRYIEYYAEEENVIDSPVISAFDLLYKEFDKSLERLEAKLNKRDSRYKSEQIAAAVLRDILRQDKFQSVLFHNQIYLKQLVSSENEYFTEDERNYIQNRASCDFVLYYRIGKRPLAAIEIDGHYHERKEQIERDRKKDSILRKAGLPLLRLKTTDSEIEKKMTAFIERSMG